MHSLNFFKFGSFLFLCSDYANIFFFDLLQENIFTRDVIKTSKGRLVQTFFQTMRRQENTRNLPKHLLDYLTNQCVPAETACVPKTFLFYKYVNDIKKPIIQTVIWLNTALCFSLHIRMQHNLYNNSSKYQ